MLEKIKMAEDAIRNGNTKTGFEILRQVLAEDPDSERAWWVMSGLVPREQRANCLMQVLRINPENQMARETLNKLVESSTQDGSSPSQRLVGNYLTWLYAQRSKIHITLIGKSDLISATTEPKLLGRVRTAIKEDNFTPALFRNKTQIPFDQINRIRQTLNSLRIYYQDMKRENSILLELEDKDAAEQALSELTKALGDGYSQSEKPMGIASTLGISAILLIVTGGITGLLYWGALEVNSGRAAATGSIQSLALINLFNAIGPTGAGIIGAVLLLIALGVSAGLLMSPPKAKEIVRLRLGQ